MADDREDERRSEIYDFGNDDGEVEAKVAVHSGAEHEDRTRRKSSLEMDSWRKTGKRGRATIVMVDALSRARSQAKEGTQSQTYPMPKTTVGYYAVNRAGTRSDRRNRCNEKEAAAAIGADGQSF